MAYKTFAAFAEESNSGWVWVWETNELKSRKIVKIEHQGRAVYCECRTIDPNFLYRYNQKPRIAIPEDPKNALVISDWYRAALGGIVTQEDAPLRITPAKIPVWRAFRAASHHPDLVARLATYLGVTGVWLGVWGLLLALLPSHMFLYCMGPRRISLFVAVLLGALGVTACRPVKR